MKQSRAKRIRIFHWIFAGALLFVCLIALFGGVWYSPEIRAQLVTADGRPIEGAVVVANWEIQNWVSGSTERQLALREAVTDENGTFSIPRWGPLISLYGALDISAPNVRVFHPQFYPLVIENVVGIPTKRAPIFIKFRLQDQKIVLKPFNYSITKYEQKEELEGFMRDIRDIYSSGWSNTTKSFRECYWKETPNLVAAVKQMNDELQRREVELQLKTGYEYAYNDGTYCK